MKITTIGVFKVILFFVGLIPFVFYVVRFLSGELANPVEYVTHGTGKWALIFLVLTLTITPIRLLTGYVRVVQFRRQLGLFTFFYVTVHFLIYSLLDVYLNLDIDSKELWQYLKEDIIERPYITLGFIAFLLLIPLAITSTQGFRRRLGKRWNRLHQLVYVVVVLGLIHYFLLVKRDLQGPALFTLMFVLLLMFRWQAMKSQQTFLRLSFLFYLLAFATKVCFDLARLSGLERVVGISLGDVVTTVYVIISGAVMIAIVVTLRAGHYRELSGLVQKSAYWLAEWLVLLAACGLMSIYLMVFAYASVAEALPGFAILLLVSYALAWLYVAIKKRRLAAAV